MDQLAFGTVSTTTQPRSTMRFKFKPVGYDDSAAFYIYNSHYKASTGSDNADRRLIEATSIRANSDALGNGAHVLYVGDFNFYHSDSTEPAWGALTAAGNGQAVDPINRVGDWTNNSSFKDVHTQSPTTTSRYGGQVAGGMDDRFDFQLSTAEVNSGEGFSIIGTPANPASLTYHAFGNNGTTYNTDIDNVSNTYPFDGVTFTASRTRSQLLTDLASVTDHIPVVADYRLPSKMSVQVASIPSTVSLGASVPISVSVTNSAPVTFSQFADELDYTINVTGSLSGGGFTDTNPAASGPHFHDVFLDTSTPGLKTGMITVMATSDQASSPLFTMPVSFTVQANFLAADFNQDGLVNSTDLNAWRMSFGTGSGALKSQGDADNDGDVDVADFNLWQRQVGQLPSSSVTTASVPEPATGRLLLAMVALIAARRRSNQA
jgi:hypothetical protein